MRKMEHFSEILIVSIVLLLCIFVYLLASRTQTGYETSFYTGLPIWYFLIITLSFTLFTVLLLFYTAEEKKSLILIVTLLFVFVIASAWIFKYGKPYGIGDIYIHLFHITKIEEIGYLSRDNFYPITHILLVTLHSITTIDNYILITWSAPLLFPLFVIFVYLIGKEIFSRKVGWIAAFFVILSPFLMREQGALTPLILSYLFLYMGFLLLIKNLENTRFSSQILLLLFISSIMVFVHLQTAILFSSTVLCFYFMWIFLKICFKIQTKINWWIMCIIIFTILLFFIWIFWVNPYARKLYIGMLKTFYSSSSSPPSIEQRSVTIRPSEKFLVRRINIIITTILSAIILLYGLKNFKRNKFKNIPSSLFIVIYLAMCTVFYFASTIFISKEFGISGRYVWMASLVYPILMGYALYRIIYHDVKCSNNKKLIIRYSLIILFLSLLFFVSIMEMYPRPEQGYYSPYTTNNVFVGMKWGYAHMNHSNSKIMGGGDHFNALALYMFGEKDYSMFRGSTNGLLKFLGYDPQNYEHRGLHEIYKPDNKTQYIYYEPLMSYFLANPKYAKSIVTVQQTELDTKRNLQKIYDSKDFCVYKLLK